MPKLLCRDKSDKKGRPESKPVVVTKPAGALAGLAEFPAGPIGAADDGTIQAQAAQISDWRLQTVQRQALASQIGRVQGNQHLQRVIAAVKVTRDPGSIASTGIRGSGSTVPFKSEMEQAFARDFSHVRAHTGTEAHRASKVLGANAYTVGNDIAFGTSTPDRGTVAHELTHIVQHETSRGVQASGVTTKSAPAEREARAVQQATVSGQELPTISETLASSSIAGNWYIRDIDNYWEIRYHMGETAADDLIIAIWVSQRMETAGGEEEFTTEMTPAALGADALVSESGLPPGSLVLSPRQPDEAGVLHCIINPRLREDMQAAVRAELLRLDGLGTSVGAAAEGRAGQEVAPPSTGREREGAAWRIENGVLHLSTQFFSSGIPYFHDPILRRPAEVELPPARVQMTGPGTGPGVTARVEPIYELPRARTNRLEVGMFSFIYETNSDVHCYRIRAINDDGIEVQPYTFSGYDESRQQFGGYTLDSPQFWGPEAIGPNLSLRQLEHLRVWQDPAVWVAFVSAVALSVGIAGPAAGVTGMAGGLGPNIGLHVLSGALSSGITSFLNANVQAMMQAENPARFWEDRRYDIMRILRESLLASIVGGVSGALTNVTIAGITTRVEVALAYFYQSMGAFFLSIIQNIVQGIGSPEGQIEARFNQDACRSMLQSFITTNLQ